MENCTAICTRQPLIASYRFLREATGTGPPTESKGCSMCGEFCAIKTVERELKNGIVPDELPP